MFWLRNKKVNFPVRTLICRPDFSLSFQWVFLLWAQQDMGSGYIEDLIDMGESFQDYS